MDIWVKNYSQRKLSMKKWWTLIFNLILQIFINLLKNIVNFHIISE